MAQSISAGSCRADERREVILSLIDGDVWASWPDGRASVNLGGHETVTTEMLDYLNQSVVAERLLSRDLTSN